MFKTRVTEMLKIKYPIMQGGIHHLATPEFAAAISNAGCLGTLNALIYPNVTEFREAIKKLKSLTNNTFCVNISMLPRETLGELTPEYFKVIVEEGVPVVETAGRDPKQFVPMLKEAGIKLIHKVPAVKFAKKAEEAGADIVTIIGVEAAGHPSMDEVSTMVLGNKVAKTVKIPVLIGGGIVDGRGLVAALALGADGVVMGTRFTAIEESIIHPNFKEWMVKASETDTLLVQRSIKNMARAMRNKAALKCLEMENRGAGIEELLTVIGGRVGKRCQLEGDLEGGLFVVGQAVGLIDEIKPVKKVVEDIIKEAEMVMRRLNSLAE